VIARQVSVASAAAKGPRAPQKTGRLSRAAKSWSQAEVQNARDLQRFLVKLDSKLLATSESLRIFWTEIGHLLGQGNRPENNWPEGGRTAIGQVDPWRHRTGGVAVFTRPCGEASA